MYVFLSAYTSDAGVGCGPRHLVPDTRALGHGLLGLAEETRHFPALVPPCDGDDDSQQLIHVPMYEIHHDVEER